ncbi:hypothetical protein D3OALGA1CA_1810 [Olavius algarvensis associated proteobacterium Delta 3]|nr:hypothetical protein D3OALGA1CA_1810 [Olavius algarvensis associated proteobacterium Delta 3]CAB5136249.1 hypothetical protein D3OALGB2SA_3952 [Olavius algarvensis associated proteobacterium Delta 3]
MKFKNFDHQVIMAVSLDLVLVCRRIYKIFESGNLTLILFLLIQDEVVGWVNRCWPGRCYETGSQPPGTDRR